MASLRENIGRTVFVTSLMIGSVAAVETTIWANDEINRQSGVPTEPAGIDLIARRIKQEDQPLAAGETILAGLLSVYAGYKINQLLSRRDEDAIEQALVQGGKPNHARPTARYSSAELRKFVT